MLDLDGTLMDFEQAEKLALQTTFENFHIPVTEENAMRYDKINKALWKSFEQGKAKKEKLVNTRFSMLLSQLEMQGDPVKMNTFYLNELSKHGILFDGVIEMLEEIEDGCTIAIATNGVEKTQAGRVKASALHPFVDLSITSEAAKAAKPSEKFFNYALKMLGVNNKQKVLMVGDSLEADIKGGNKFGIDTCWYNPHNLPLPEDITPTYVISNYDELVRIVEGETTK